MKVILSTGNSRKIEEINAIFVDSNVTLLSLADAGISGEADEKDGKTLQENALKKAIFAHEGSFGKYWTMSDDTGIFIDELNGLPGVNTALWPYERPKTEDILKELATITNRKASFKTVVAIVSPLGEQHFFTGEVDGTILTVPRKEAHPRMPYSTIFLPNGHEKTWAEMTIQEENEISHRGKAFRQARDFLETLTGEHHAQNS